MKEIKKKSIEIHLLKANKVTWGSIGISPSTGTKIELAPVDKYSPNKWTPCAIITNEEYTPVCHNMQLVKYEPPVVGKLSV